MKINISRQKNIITLPTDFATLEDITSTGYLHYVIKYEVNVPRAVKEQTFLVKIHASPRSESTREVPGFTQMNGAQVVQSLLNQQTALAELNRSFVQNYIASITSDITSKIPNNKASSIARSNTKGHITDSSNLGEQPLLFQRKGMQLVKASELTNQNVSQPILQTPLFQPRAQDVSPVSSPQENGFDLILQYGIDPSVVGTKSNHFADTGRVRAGVLRHPTGVAKEVVGTVIPGSVKAKFGILSKVMGAPKDAISDQLGLANNDYAYVFTQEESNSVVVTEDMFLPIGAVGDQFYLIFELQDIHGVQAEIVSGMVNHSKNLSIFTIPTIPPFVSVAELSGNVRLTIRQIDPNGSGVYIYRRVIDSHSAITEAEYTLLNKFPIRTQDGSKVYVDKFSSLRPTIYRLVAHNRADIKSHEFASVILTPNQNVRTVKTKVPARRLFLSVYPKIIGKSVQIELNDVPSGVLAVNLYRIDLSRHQTIKESTLIGNTVYLSQLPVADGKYFITDDNPIDQRVYEYRVLLIFKDGTELWATTPAVIQYNPVINNVITTTSSPINVVNVGVSLDAEFVLNSSIAAGSLDQVQAAMAQQGILGFFQADFVTNRASLQNLMAYQIKRSNITTGEIEDMGVFIGTNFSDRTQGAIKGVKPLEAFHTYEYTISTHFRSAESMIPTLTTDVTYETNPSRNYSYLPSKWKHPVNIRDGTLTTSTSLKRNHSNTEFTFGIVGNILHARVTISPETPSVNEAVATTLGKGKVVVRWKVIGPIQKIDHFLVMKEEMGMKTMVGKAHAITDGNSISFVDTPSSIEPSANPSKQHSLDGLRNTDHESAISYHIVPVLFNYTHGSATKTSQIIAKKMT